MPDEEPDSERLNTLSRFSIHSVFYNLMPQTGWLMNNTNLLLIILEARKFKIKVLVDSMSGKVLLPGSEMTISLPCLYMAEETWELPRVSFMGALISFTRALST